MNVTRLISFRDVTPNRTFYYLHSSVQALELPQISIEFAIRSFWEAYDIAVERQLAP